MGRLIVGFIADTKYANRFILSGGILILGGMSTFGVVYVETMYHWYLVYGAILGIFTGRYLYITDITHELEHHKIHRKYISLQGMVTITTRNKTQSIYTTIPRRIIT